MCVNSRKPKLMSNEDPMLSVAELSEMPPGDEQSACWINPGLQGVVTRIETIKKKAGGNFWKVTLRDEVGSATLPVTLFTPPKFNEGDLIEISGQGLRLTEYQGKPQVSTGQKTEIHKLGQSVHHQEQEERRAEGKPAMNGDPFPVAGQTVGMAVKESLTLHTKNMATEEVNEAVCTGEFWAAIHETASDIIRISLLLEKGKLAKPVRERNGEEAPPARQAPPPQRQAAPPSGRRQDPVTDRQAANQENRDGSPIEEEDVPF